MMAMTQQGPAQHFAFIMAYGLGSILRLPPDPAIAYHHADLNDLTQSAQTIFTAAMRYGQTVEAAPSMFVDSFVAIRQRRLVKSLPRPGHRKVNFHGH
jgi:hypothetical protein